MKKGKSPEKVPPKSKKVEESKNSPKKTSPSPKKKVSPKESPIQPRINKGDLFPKNANEFCHILDDSRCCVADIEYMLELRHHKKIPRIEKGVVGSGPSFYDDDLKKYIKKISNKPYLEKKLIQTNIGDFRQIFGDRTKYAINDTQYKFEVTLRTPMSVGKSIVKGGADNSRNRYGGWNSTSIPKEKNLFENLLPPVLNKSKELFARYGEKIGRPVIKVNKDGYINGEKVKRRVFDYNNNLALRYPAEHYPSSTYVNEYGIQNIESIKHVLNFDNRTMTSYWITRLRGEKKKKFLPEETKHREKKLRDKTAEKVWPKG